MITITDLIRDCCIDFHNNYTKGYEDSSKEYRSNEDNKKYWGHVILMENRIITKTVNEILERYEK